MRATHYHSASRGPVKISTMVLEHARHAMNKLVREEPHRADEIEGLRAHVAQLEAQAAGGAQ